jgi:hypothetical protein
VTDFIDLTITFANVGNSHPAYDMVVVVQYEPDINIGAIIGVDVTINIIDHCEMEEMTY